MATNDKLQVNDSLKSLDSEASVGPYRFALSGNKIITFLSPEEMPWEEAEELMLMVSTAAPSELFQKWLSEDDHKKFKDEKLNLKQVIELSKKIANHFEAFFGDAPKD